MWLCFETIQDHIIRDFTKKLLLIESFEAARHSHSRTKCHEKKASIFIYLCIQNFV